MLRPLEKFHIQHVEHSRTDVMHAMRERDFAQGTQRDVAGNLFDRSTLRLVRQLLRGARLADPDRYIIHGVDVILAPFAGLESDSQNHQAFVFQKQVVMRLLFNGNRRGAFLG
jgi:hypothetical protein